MRLAASCLAEFVIQCLSFIFLSLFRALQVVEQLYKISSVSLSPNVNGQMMVSGMNCLMMNESRRMMLCAILFERSHMSSDTA